MKWIFAIAKVQKFEIFSKLFSTFLGPNSALSQNGGIGRQARSVAQCSAIPADENALHLSRLADRLAFLIVPNFGQKMPISILFKSEAVSEMEIGIID